MAKFRYIDEPDEANAGSTTRPKFRYIDDPNGASTGSTTRPKFRYIDEGSQAPAVGTVTKLPDDTPVPDRDLTQIANRYQLSMDEVEGIKTSFETAYKEAPKNPSLIQRLGINTQQAWYSNTAAGAAKKGMERDAGVAPEIGQVTKKIEAIQKAKQNRQIAALGPGNLGATLEAKSGPFSAIPDEKLDEMSMVYGQRLEQLQGIQREKLISGLQEQAERSGRYAGMGDWDTPVEGAVALFGQFLGAAMTPETLVGGTGAKLLGKAGPRVAKEIASHAGVNAAVNPVLQDGNVASGDQAQFLMSHLLMDAGMGGAMGTIPTFLKSRKSLLNWYKNRSGINKDRVAALDESLSGMGINASEGPVDAVGDVVAKKKGSIRAAWDRIAVPISARLERISPGLGKVFTRFEHEVAMDFVSGIAQVEPFLKQYKKIPTRHRKILDLALKNGDGKLVDEFTDAYNMRPMFDNVRGVLDQIHEQAHEVGLPVGFIDDYMPRIVKDLDGLRAHLKKKGEWGKIQSLVETKAREMGRDPDSISPKMRAELTNLVLTDKNPPTGGSSNFKERKIDILDEGLNKYYHDTSYSLTKYIERSYNAIHTQRLLGKNANSKMDISLSNETSNEAVQESLGGFVDQLIQGNKIPPHQEGEVYDMVKSYFKGGSVPAWVNSFRSITHIGQLANPISALTQLKDLNWLIMKNGEWNAVRGMADAFRKKGNKISMQDIGLDNIGAEFTDYKKLSKYTDKAFKYSLFRGMDRFGKEAFINSTFRRFQKQTRAPKGSKTYNKVRKELEPAFMRRPGELDQVMDDFAKGEMTPLTQWALWDQLEMIQPITRASMPEAYLNSPTGRIFYLLKTFTVRQLDAFRRETYDKIKAGKVAEGSRNLIKMGVYFGAVLGAPVDQVKDFILGREVSFDDAVMENLIQATGLSRYSVYRAKDHGPIQAAVELATPPVNMFQSFYKDAKMLSEGEWHAKNSEAVKHLPFGGKIYYWNAGAGAEKERMRRRN